MLYGSTSAPTNVNERKKPMLYQRMVASSTTGVFAILFASPADKVKTMLQAQSGLPGAAEPPYKGTFGCFRHIIATEGVGALWQGLNAAVPRMAVANMLELVSYDLSKEALLERGWDEGPLVYSLSALSAGFWVSRWG